MQAVVQVVDKAQVFADLIKEGERAVGSGDISAGAAQLGKLLESLPSLEGVPRFKDSRARVEHLCDDVEAELKPRLVRAITDQSHEQFAETVALFTHIGRGGEAERCYVDCRQGPLYERWNALSHDGEKASFADVLTTFQQAVVEFAQRETSWCQKVGIAPDRGRALVQTLVVDTISTLATPWSASLAKLHLDGKSDVCDMSTICELFSQVKAWSAQLSAVLQVDEVR